MSDHATALSRYTALMAAHGIDIKGRANKYTALNGNMFSFMDASGALFLRLSPQDQTAHDAAFNTGPVLQHGSVMRGYVHLPQSVWQDDRAMARLIAACLRNAQSLKPKPKAKAKATTRAAKKKP